MKKFVFVLIVCLSMPSLMACSVVSAVKQDIANLTGKGVVMSPEQQKAYEAREATKLRYIRSMAGNEGGAMQPAEVMAAHRKAFAQAQEASRIRYIKVQYNADLSHCVFTDKLVNRQWASGDDQQPKMLVQDYRSIEFSMVYHMGHIEMYGKPDLGNRGYRYDLSKPRATVGQLDPQLSSVVWQYILAHQPQIES